MLMERQLFAQIEITVMYFTVCLWALAVRIWRLPENVRARQLFLQTLEYSETIVCKNAEMALYIKGDILESLQCRNLMDKIP